MRKIILFSQIIIGVVFSQLVSAQSFSVPAGTPTSTTTTGNYFPVGIYVDGSTTTGNGLSTAIYIGKGTGATPSGYRSSTAVGVGALQTSEGQRNAAMGFNALNATTSTDNSAFGHNALVLSSTGNHNTGIGSSALSSLTSGVGNVAVGSLSLRFATTSGDNIAVGYNALSTTTTGGQNIAIGSSTLRNSVSTANTAIGYHALENHSGGTGSNIAIGHNALLNQTQGSGNLGIGVGVALPSLTGSNQLSIMNSIVGSNMNDNTQCRTSIGISGGPASTTNGITPVGTFVKLQLGGSSTIPSLRLQSVPTYSGTLPVQNPTGQGKYLFVDEAGVVAQASVPGLTSSCSTIGSLARTTDASGNLGCSQIFDNLTNVGIGLGATTPTAKLDIELVNGTTPGTVRLRNLQQNDNVQLNPILIDDQGFLWKGESSLSRPAATQQIIQLEQQVKKLENQLNELMLIIEAQHKISISRIADKPFNIAPKPVQGALKIFREKINQPGDEILELRNINNELIYTKRLNNASKFEIQLPSSVLPGNYILLFTKQNRTIQSEIVTIIQ